MLGLKFQLQSRREGFQVYVHVQGPQAYAQDTLQPLTLIVRPMWYSNLFPPLPPDVSPRLTQRKSSKQRKMELFCRRET
jgi:hypothetical protein